MLQKKPHRDGDVGINIRWHRDVVCVTKDAVDAEQDAAQLLKVTDGQQQGLVQVLVCYV